MKKLLLTLLLSTGLYASQEDSELSHLDANSTYLRIKENLSQEISSDNTKFSILWHEDIKTDSTNSITVFPTKRFTLDDDGLFQEILMTNNDDSLETNQSLDPLLKDTDNTPSIYKDYEYSIDCLEEQSIPNSNSFICSVNSTAPATSTTNKIIYKCTEEGCDKSFTSNWYLTSHIKTHRMEKIYKCKAEGCDTSFSTFLNLKEHIKTHKVKKSYKCTAEGCNYSTAYNQTLIAHIEAHKKKKPFKCKVERCNKFFKTNRVLNSHILRMHPNEKIFKCKEESCNQCFDTNLKLKMHMRLHSKKKIYECPKGECDKFFFRSSHLNEHMQTHTGAKNYKCTYKGCNYASYRSNSLKRHIERMHNDEDFDDKEQEENDESESNSEDYDDGRENKFIEKRKKIDH